MFSVQVIEARREEEERRRNKYAKMESEREKVRQGIRDKVILLDLGVTHLSSAFLTLLLFEKQYNIKKVEEQPAFQLPDLDNSLNRQKKSPAQLAINTEDDGSFLIEIFLEIQVQIGLI